MSDVVDRLRPLTPTTGWPIDVQEAADEIVSLRSQIEALTRERDEARGRAKALQAAADKAAELDAEGYKALHYSNEVARADLAEASLAKAREALEPFAAAANCWDEPNEFAGSRLATGSNLTVGDLRRARDFLASLKGGPDNG